MKNVTITELAPAFSEHRCGAQFELSFEGEDNWLALVAKTDLTKEQAHHMAKLFAAAPKMFALLETMTKKGWTIETRYAVASIMKVVKEGK